MQTVRVTVVAVLALVLAAGCGSKKEKELSPEGKEFKRVADHLNPSLSKLKGIEKTISDSKGKLKSPLKALGAAKKLLSAFAEASLILKVLSLPVGDFETPVVKIALETFDHALGSWKGDDCDGISCALSQLSQWVAVLDAVSALAEAAKAHGVDIIDLR